MLTEWAGVEGAVDSMALAGKLYAVSTTRGGKKVTDRAYDIVLFGATGFTGGLTAEYLAAHAPDGLRWALAGRNQAKLEAVRERLAAIDPGCTDLPLVNADSTDDASLRALAESTRVLATTVGPYALYGEPLVAACAAAGTDYCDLTGEPEFVDKMWLKYDEPARKSGARLVHTCGFDSIPHDLGAYFTVLQLPEGEPITVEGYVRAGGEFSGGTYASAITGFSRARQTISAGRERRASEPRPEGRKIHSQVRAPHRDGEQGGWVVPLPTIDPFVVRRSAAALDRYGPDFTYGHYMVAKHLTSVAGLGLAIPTAFLAAQLPPTRKALMKFAPKQGEGPSAAKRSKSWFRVRFVGKADGARVVTEFAGGDPGYTETAKMLAESAMALALDDIPDLAGQLTPVTAIGDALLERLPKAGMTIRVVD